ncbi:MAG: type II toxin-antitoxin system PemK/MazF family toxin [Candidatus Zambryskibacteria bacterium]|nr:type II toxin-antitoxin system PemK/MazF family toxin [Candidatus Zambryskibacteria bacterium]
MGKDFKKWHKEKNYLHEEKVRPFFHEKEIWFTSLGLNIGFEQDGRGENFLRPIIIVKKFNNEVLWGIPLTKNKKKGRHYFSLKFDDDKESTAILSQIRLIDSKRLQYKIGEVKNKDFLEIKRKLTQFLE